MSPLIGLSSSSVYPENTPAAFEIAAALGYDGIEVMVGTDSVSQDLEALAALVDHYQVPVISIHAPCLLVTQRVWGTDSWVKAAQGPSDGRGSWCVNGCGAPAV